MKFLWQWAQFSTHRFVYEHGPEARRDETEAAAAQAETNEVQTPEQAEALEQAAQKANHEATVRRYLEFVQKRGEIKTPLVSNEVGQEEQELATVLSEELQASADQAFFVSPDQLRQAFASVPASVFLSFEKEHPGSLKQLFLENDQVDFRGNENAKWTVGLGDLFTADQEFVAVNGVIGRRSARGNKVGYLDQSGRYLPVLGGEIVTFPSEDEIAAQRSTFQQNGIAPVENEVELMEAFLQDTLAEEEFRENIQDLEIAAGVEANEAIRQGIVETASLLRVAPAAIDAVVQIESAGKLGATRFEPHIFRRMTNEGYNRQTARKLATSFGAFQIMGFNSEVAGFTDVEDMIQQMSSDVGAQFRAFAQFVAHNPTMHQAFRNRDWATFARYYNGPRYRDNEYDTKMERFFRSSRFSQQIAV